jgi:two-component sensor histidine kinase
MQELSHRSKNLLSVVQSMATQVARQSNSFDDFVAGFSERLCAFAETHDLLINNNWRGAHIRDLIRVHLTPFHNVRENSVVVEGPELRLNPKAAEQIGLAFHELGTNAVKHGALSTPSGVVTIRWDIRRGEPRDPLLCISWEEIGGPHVRDPQRHGFGDVVLTKVVPGSLGGAASLEFKPEGVNWVLLVPSRSALV